jgi:hypothetical protein
MSRMKTYLVDIRVEVQHRVLVRASTPEKAEGRALDRTEMPYDNYRVLTASAEERPTIDAKRYREIKGGE